jgi:opacity protein-like surface antigen
METKFLRAFCICVLPAASMPALAQYVATPPPSQSAQTPAPVQSAASPGAAYIHLDPKNGQSEQQQWSDRYDCHRWARAQSGFDPTQQAASASPSESSAKADEYRRAMTACLESRGYTVHYGPKSTSAAPPPSPPPPVAPPVPPSVHARTYSAESELKYRALRVQIDGGYTVATGTTDRYLDDGANFGFGFTWFPSSVLPLGLRVDGSYSRFRARSALLDLYGGNFTSGHDNIYGGDADLQLDLAHSSPFWKLYLLGGAGWYREQTYLRQVTWYEGDICGWYYCAPGYVPVVTGRQRTTSPWHSSWNAGLGLEVATGGNASFFVEARYQRISTFGQKLQFVPIRMGLRF